MASGSVDRLCSFNLPSDTSPWPASILLAERAHIAFSRNHTTARAKRLQGNNSTVEVTFWIADPPDVSFYTLYCKSLMGTPDSEDAGDLEVQSYVAPIPVSGRVEADVLWTHPHVVGAEGRFVLLSTQFRVLQQYEFFMYKGDPKSPSLESLPLPDDHCSLRTVEFAIVPRGDDGHYLLIALDYHRENYRLHFYSSEDATWTTKELPNPCPRIHIISHKVFVIRDGLLLWVGLLKGILVCDVLQEPHHAEYIPLPEPLLGNREQVKTLQRGVRRFRDLTCVDGLIKFIEMEHREIERKIILEGPINTRTKDVLYDSDLMTLVSEYPEEPKTRTEVSVNGWSAITWTRNIGSNCWRKGHSVDIDDILVDDSLFSALLSSSKKGESAGRLGFRNLSSAWPALSADKNDILYLRSSSKSGEGAMVAVDLAEKKALKVEARRLHPFGKYFYASTLIMLRPCALANHLKTTPGIETSASQIALMGANEPNNTAIHVGEADSYKSENKRPRLSAEKVNHAQNGAQSTVQNVLISQVHPNQNNMPPQLQINRWEQPGYTGYSSWPHQNYMPPPQCFNNWAGPLPPASNGNHQSLWQQPLLLEQQAAPRRTFGPHEAPYQFFNNWWGARYIGNSQQHPAGNSYSYGAPSGTSSGNHHQHR